MCGIEPQSLWATSVSRAENATGQSWMMFDMINRLRGIDSWCYGGFVVVEVDGLCGSLASVDGR